MKNEPIRISSNGIITFQGLTYNTNSNQGVKNFNRNKFIEQWLKRAEEIKKQNFTASQIVSMHSDLVHELYSFAYFFRDHSQEFSHIITEVNFAFRIAQSNYRDSKKGFAGFITGLFVNKTIDRLNIPTSIIHK